MPLPLLLSAATAPIAISANSIVRGSAMADTNTAAAASFQNAEAYEQVMGRWSRRLAPLLIRFGGLSDGDRVLDVGCGTGSLTFTLPEIANVAGVTGIDLTGPFVEFARARNADPRVSFQRGDARVLPFEDNSFDRAFSMLVLQFIPDAARAVAEMHRVVRPGGTVTAAVWDDYSGLPHFRLICDMAAVLDPSIVRPVFRPMSKPNEMATLWRELGFLDVEQTSLLIRMEFSCFDDYWLPFTRGEGPPGQFVVSLSDATRAALTDHVRRGYLCGQPDGPRSFACVAWACRGTVPA
jgi:ubiquinone/menaquinone biosynthesis C-methylase UbiE